MRIFTDKYGVDWLECKALLSTKCENEWERLNMMNPVPKEVADFFNISRVEKGEPPIMWCYDDQVVKVSSIKIFWEAGMGITTIDVDSEYDFRVQGSVKELCDLLKGGNDE